MAYTQLHYIIQEALSNSVKHSNASEIDIKLFKENNEISLVIQDNGIGFSIEKLEGKKGIGLNILKYRARLIGAAFEIQSEEGEGCKITCKFIHKIKTNK